MFKEKNQDCEIGFSFFALLRPKNALQSKKQSLDQCKCSRHKSSYLLLKALGMNFDKISFWNTAFWDSEDFILSC